MEKQQKVLVAGASGSLGLEIVKVLNAQGRPIRALTSSDEGKEKLIPYTNDIWKADASKGGDAIANITEGVDTVISALGNSISLFTPNEKSFYKIDYQSNQNILRDAEKHGVKRFVYTSIKGADVEEDYTVARAHKLFEQALRATDINSTIIRPVGFFSGLHDLVIMAKRKVIPLIGDGSAKTNSIHHADLAKVVCRYVDEGPEVTEVGGPEIHTRLEMAEMIQETIGGKIVKVPEVIAEIGLKLPNFFEDIHEKLDYFKFVTTNDMIGEKNGNITFKEYLANLDKNQLP
ncbi:SDR family oxidoreductase [Autumnicola psychrophila]|uniref:NAD(P)H-binding protein n=1 Tax=Autumnicola psychrophila TaxID=3075592 RepID=A0ABU3DML3_9FLAO|nr:NAD(P)H-binding protein [Zunongwangia sp. F225]MDT0684953.1 NAD(P)H-binding protein [Zunongwangia sp. F225]